MNPGDSGEGGPQVNQMTAVDVETGVHDTQTYGAAPADGVASTVIATADLAQTFEAVVANVRSSYLGRDLTVRLSLCCLMAEGHLLVEDHPGVGKTTLAKALARSLGLGFGRVQLTADLLPADVTGAVVFDRDTGLLAFRPGPVFTNVLLADELNRASPKAQSALLEAMEERQVSADGTSHPLPRPFMVIATQNPFDAAGTFPLPHSQRDRFLLRLDLGYPDRETEDLLLSSTGPAPPPKSSPPSATRVPGRLRRRRRRHLRGPRGPRLRPRHRPRHPEPP
jgi:MoxR-like ATPase